LVTDYQNLLNKTIMGNLSAAMLIYNEGSMTESKAADKNGALDNGEEFVTQSPEQVLDDEFSNASGDMEVIPMPKQFDAIPLVMGALGGFYGYNKYKGKKHGWAYIAGLSALGIVVGGLASKGIYKLKSSI
jgi:hypothetical protein